MGTLMNVNISNIIATSSSKTTSNITGVTSAYAENIRFNNVQVFIKGHNVRPSFIFHDVKNGSLINPVVYSEFEKVETLVKDENCENIRLVQ
ncbi:MAG: hypothetical protein ACK5HT_10345 [Draconibacterium sp.]